MGDRNARTLRKLLKRVFNWSVEVYCTDKLAAYKKLLPANRLVQSKSETLYIERDNSNTRHWFKRFSRKSKVISRSLEMVDLTMALFAKFHVNGTMDPLINWTQSLFS